MPTYALLTKDKHQENAVSNVSFSDRLDVNVPLTPSFLHHVILTPEHCLKKVSEQDFCTFYDVCWVFLSASSTVI